MAKSYKVLATNNYFHSKLRPTAAKVLVRPRWMPPHGTEAIKVPAEGDAQLQEREPHAKDPQYVCEQTGSHLRKTPSALIKAEFDVCVDAILCAYQCVCVCVCLKPVSSVLIAGRTNTLYWNT